MRTILLIAALAAPLVIAETVQADVIIPKPQPVPKPPRPQPPLPKEPEPLPDDDDDNSGNRNRPLMVGTALSVAAVLIGFRFGRRGQPWPAVT